MGYSTLFVSQYSVLIFRIACYMQPTCHEIAAAGLTCTFIIIMNEPTTLFTGYYYFLCLFLLFRFVPLLPVHQCSVLMCISPCTLQIFPKFSKSTTQHAACFALWFLSFHSWATPLASLALNLSMWLFSIFLAVTAYGKFHTPIYASSCSLSSRSISSFACSSISTASLFIFISATFCEHRSFTPFDNFRAFDFANSHKTSQMLHMVALYAFPNFYIHTTTKFSLSAANSST